MKNSMHDYTIRGLVNGEVTVLQLRGTRIGVYWAAKEFVPGIDIKSVSRDVDWDDK
jgi:hypothetical protein